MTSPLRAIVFLIAPLTLLGATCVTDARQKGPTGPWVGEIINTGPGIVSNARVHAKVYDATGRLYQEEYGNRVSAGVCPFTLRPGQHGWFEIFFQKGLQEPEPVPPLRAEFPLVAEAYDAPLALDQNLTVTLIASDRAQRSARIEVRNDSTRIYSEINVCGVLRGLDGKVSEIGDTSGPPLPALLRPGESLSLVMYFNMMPEGNIEFFPLAYDRTPPPPCCMP